MCNVKPYMYGPVSKRGPNFQENFFHNFSHILLFLLFAFFFSDLLLLPLFIFFLAVKRSNGGMESTVSSLSETQCKLNIMFSLGD